MAFKHRDGGVGKGAPLFSGSSMYGGFALRQKSIANVIPAKAGNQYKTGAMTFAG